jgi:hypothetical protein
LAVPTVRYQSEYLVKDLQKHGVLIRINPMEFEVPNSKHISLAMGGLEALNAIDGLLKTY